MKINRAFLNGELLKNWVPDEDDPEEESQALDTLEIAGIIKSPGGYEGAPAEFQHRIVDLREGFAHSAPNRRITDFDYNNFLHFCEKNGINPSSGGISAQLKILDDVQPVITIGDSRYPLESLNSSGTPQPIVAYAAKHPDREIPIDELRTQITREQLRKADANIKQIFKKNVFREKGLLGAFAEIDAKSFRLKMSALLTSEQVNAISKAST